MNLEDQLTALLDATRRESDMIAEADRLLAAEIEALRQCWSRLDHLQQVQARFFDWISERSPHLLQRVAVSGIRPPAVRDDLSGDTSRLARQIAEMRGLVQPQG